MRHYTAAFAALALLLAGCGGEAPVAQAPPSTSQPPTTTQPPPSTTSSATPTSSSEAPSSSQKPLPVAPPSSNVKDCFDGDCTLLLAKPAKIPLDTKTLHYSSMRVTSISAESLAYFVPYPGGGGASSTVGVGLGGSAFGFKDGPMIRVGLTLVDGKPALVLQRDNGS
ncbi:hypothetical protein [Amycolatopsis sp. CA-230715]|uniref:hypothetical protein n=1 Tax=Amycolatopsis sp. CA-230715 TaxID=2745196 RepID=UPI001C02F289|nr:hypothetical protein [Amycolatopsis sp. CA-230715]